MGRDERDGIIGRIERLDKRVSAIEERLITTFVGSKKSSVIACLRWVARGHGKHVRKLARVSAVSNDLLSFRVRIRDCPYFSRRSDR